MDTGRRGKKMPSLCSREMDFICSRGPWLPADLYKCVHVRVYACMCVFYVKGYREFSKQPRAPVQALALRG